jgi:hypothetical protein
MGYELDRRVPGYRRQPGDVLQQLFVSQPPRALKV